MYLVLVEVKRNTNTAVLTRGNITQVSREIEITIPSFGGIQISRANHEDNEALMQFLMEILDEEMHDEVRKFFDEEDDVELLHGSESFCG